MTIDSTAKKLGINKNITEIYVDYALHSKIGIYCSKPFMRINFKPQEKIQWQIEGEALAIKTGIYYFLRKKLADEQKLIVYTDNKTLLKKFKSRTRAGIWLQEAHKLAHQNKLELEIKWVKGKENLADYLTREKKVKSKLIKNSLSSNH